MTILSFSLLLFWSLLSTADTAVPRPALATTVAGTKTSKLTSSVGTAAAAAARVPPRNATTTTTTMTEEEEEEKEEALGLWSGRGMATAAEASRTREWEEEEDRTEEEENVLEENDMNQVDTGEEEETVARRHQMSSSSPPPEARAFQRQSFRSDDSDASPSSSSSLLPPFAVAESDDALRVARGWHYAYTTTLEAVFRGDVAPFCPPEVFGQTLEQELAAASAWSRTHSIPHARGGMGGSLPPPPSSTMQHHRTASLLLYGGAQYHRSLKYYTEQLLTVPLDPVTPEEVALLLGGRSEVHDGADVLRSVAILCRHKMSSLLESCLDDLQVGMEYVLQRFWDVVQYAVLVRPPAAMTLTQAADSSSEEARIRQLVAQAFSTFVSERVAQASAQCRYDCAALLQYVTWDMESVSRGGGARRSPTTRMPHMRGGGNGRDQQAEQNDGGGKKRRKRGSKNKNVKNNDDVDDGAKDTTPSMAVNEYGFDDDGDDAYLDQIWQSIHSLSGRHCNEKETQQAVESLVQWVTTKWRRELCNALAAKYNSFCLLPLYKEFGNYLWRTLLLAETTGNEAARTSAG